MASKQGGSKVTADVAPDEVGRPAVGSERPARGGPETGVRDVGVDLRRRLDSVYVERPEDDLLREALDDMVDVTLSGREGRAVIVTGASGAGKTTLVEQVTAACPRLADDGTGTQPGGMITVQVPASCTVADLGTEIARIAGYPLKDGLKASVAWGAAMRQLQLKDIRFVCLDEVGNLADNLNVREARKIRTHLKMALVNRHHRVGLVLSGVTPALGFLLGDTQVMRRSDVVEIRPVHGRMHRMVADAIGKLARKAGLVTPSDCATTIVPRLSHASLGAFGSCMELTKSTIVKAVRRRRGKGSTELTLGDFADAWARKYGVAADDNPFIVDQWERIDCAAIISRGGISPPEAAPTQTRRGKVRGVVV